MIELIAVACRLACVIQAARAVRRRFRPVLRYPINRDVTAGAPRPVPVSRPENPMRDTLIVARPVPYRWWDTTEREREY